MLNNDEEVNIVLTAEQSKAIEETKIRLLNLESEISIASKNLKTLKGETEKSTKDKLYQEELLNSLVSQVTIKQQELVSLVDSIKNASETLGKINSEITAKSQAQEKMVMALKDREDKVKSEELKLAEHEKIVLKISADVKSEEAEFGKKVAKLKEVISTF
jgi:hypothetical protein